MEPATMPWDAVGMGVALLGIVLAQWVEDVRQRRQRRARSRFFSFQFTPRIGEPSPLASRVNVESGSQAKGG